MFYTILETGGDVIPVKAGVGIGHNASITNNVSHSSNQVMVSIIHSFASSAKEKYIIYIKYISYNVKLT